MPGSDLRSANSITSRESGINEIASVPTPAHLPRPRSTGLEQELLGCRSFRPLFCPRGQEWPEDQKETTAVTGGQMCRHVGPSSSQGTLSLFSRTKIPSPRLKSKLSAPLPPAPSNPLFLPCLSKDYFGNLLKSIHYFSE